MPVSVFRTGGGGSHLSSGDRTLLADEAMCEMCRVAESVLSPPFGVIVYGSFGRAMPNVASDLDVLFVGAGGRREIEALTKGLVKFSHSHRLPLDEEVPYANKILCAWPELDRISSCRVFRGRPRITPIDVSPHFLRSRAMRERLIVNVLVERTLRWTHDVPRLELLRAKAARSLVATVAADLVDRGVTVTSGSVLADLIGRDGARHKRWLGFDDDTATREHLQGLIRALS
jgi:hypothetical protein